MYCSHCLTKGHTKSKCPKSADAKACAVCRGPHALSACETPVQERKCLLCDSSAHLIIKCPQYLPKWVDAKLPAGLKLRVAKPTAAFDAAALPGLGLEPKESKAAPLVHAAASAGRSDAERDAQLFTTLHARLLSEIKPLIVSELQLQVQTQLSVLLPTLLADTMKSVLASFDNRLTQMSQDIGALTARSESKRSAKSSDEQDTLSALPAASGAGSGTGSAASSSSSGRATPPGSSSIAQHTRGNLSRTLELPPAAPVSVRKQLPPPAPKR
jgi:hypothetical protein